MSTDVVVVRVFTAEDGSLGNELGIIRDSPATAGRELAIAAELNFSETVFIQSVETDVATVRIFTPGAELPFAGHPSVGTAWWLKSQGSPIAHLAVPAGDVAVAHDGELTWITGRAEWAPAFEWIELGSAADIDALDPDDFTDGQRYFYAWTDEPAGRLRSRMFAPSLGVNEDQATGSAAIALAGRLGRDLDITQGLGCRLFTQHLDDGFVRVGGYTVFDRTLTL